MRWSIKVKRGVNDLHPSGYVCISVTGSYSGIVKYLICTEYVQDGCLALESDRGIRSCVSVCMDCILCED